MPYVRTFIYYNGSPGCQARALAHYVMRRFYPKSSQNTNALIPRTDGGRGRE